LNEHSKYKQSVFKEPNCAHFSGNGCVVHIEQLMAEIRKAEEMGLEKWQSRLLISNRAHIGTHTRVGPVRLAE